MDQAGTKKGGSQEPPLVFLSAGHDSLIGNRLGAQGQPSYATGRFRRRCRGFETKNLFDNGGTRGLSIDWVRGFSRLRIVCLTSVMIGVGLAGCRQSGETFRYKLTLEVDVDGVTKTASNVVEVHCGRRSFPAKQRYCTTTGEALFMELGPKHQPLVALLTRPRFWTIQNAPRAIWYPDSTGPIFVLENVYGLSEFEFGESAGIERADSFTGFFSMIEKFREQKEAKELALELLPDLVTFSDSNDPLTVSFVEPDDLAASLGSSVHFKRALIQITREPITKSLGVRLPWLSRLRGSIAGGIIKSAQGDFSNPPMALTKTDFYAEGY